MNLDEQAERFAQKLQDTLIATLPDAGRVRSVSVEGSGRFQVTPDGAEAAQRRIDLKVSGETVGSLGFTFDLDLDHSREWLKVVTSRIHIRDASRKPILRLEYDAGMDSAPIAHWQFHAESGPMTYWLTKAEAAGRGIPKPFDLSKLHLPVGGERFRPCIEDVLHFLIRDCGVDRLDTWRASVESGREEWRRFQLASSIRDAPEEAARVLREQLGYTVEAPANPRGERVDVLRKY